MTIGTTSKKYLIIVSTARGLFWKHGFRRVSIEELCVKAQVSKMTFYKFFPNKIELAKEVFRRESQAGVANFKSILHQQNSPSETLKKIVQLKLEGSSEISSEFLYDFYEDNTEGLKDFVVEISHSSWRQIVEEIRDAQRKKIFTNAIKPELLIYLAQSMGSLVTNKELLVHYDNPHQLITELTHLMAYGISADRESGPENGNEYMDGSVAS